MIVFVIKQLRESKGISQYKLSQMTDISRTYIRNLENNKKCNPSLHILSLIAEALEVDIKDLFYTKLDIENLRKKMHRKINKYGLNSKEVLEVSQIIDLLTNLLNTEK
jgi:transcriptional regulator with XRE-family HTH domain